VTPNRGLLAAFARRSLLRRLLRPLLAFLSVVGAGVVGFRALAGVGTVDALFWLLDPTSIELHFQRHGGPATLVKAYAVVILGGLVVVGLWTGETALSALFGGTIRDEITRMQTKQQVDEQSNHVIICGYGTFGKTIAERLRGTDTSVVVVEQDETQYQRAVDDGALTVQGDARQEETLVDAGVKRADTVVGAIDDTNTNVKTAVTASQLAPTVRVVVRAGDEMDEAVARRVGADKVIVPEVVSAEQVCSGL
jgi:voltage-gated potassium channel